MRRCGASQEARYDRASTFAERSLASALARDGAKPAEVVP